MRRSLWLAAGAALGVTGTLWSRRRLVHLSDRARSGEVSGDVLRLVESGTRRAGRHLAGAVDAGRLEARWRQQELRRAIEPRR